MTARDELTELFGRIAYPETPEERDDAERAVLHMLTPRTITTPEELDALPAEVVVRSSVGVVWEKYADDYSDGDGIDFWQQVGLQRMYASPKVTLPATVLYEPQP